MKRLLTLTCAALAAFAVVTADLADARRLGGGRSLGAQRSAPTQAQPQTPPSAAPSPGAQGSATGPAANPVMPRQGTAQAPTAAPTQPAAAGAAAAPARSGMSRWLGPVAGLAAGLGLAALAAHLGIAEELLSVLLIVGLVLAAIVVLRLIFARRSQPARPLQYAGATGAAGTAHGFEPPPAPVAATTPVVPVPSRVPAGFDAERFLAEAKLQFARLQAAHDRGDRKALAEVTTPSMFAEIARDLPAGAGGHPTEIVAVNAELVEVVTEGEEHWASVRFRGLTREDGEPMPTPFDEVWNLVKPADGSSGWLLAGIRQVEAAVGHA